MSSVIKPTPTPWYRNVRPVTRYPIVYAGSSPNYDYCFSFHVPREVTPEQAEANLDFLLRAVNSHTALVEALETAAMVLGRHGGDQLDGGGWADLRKTYLNCLAALARVKVEP